MSKAFIIYPHNPEPYVWTSRTGKEELRRRYPEKSDDEILQMRIQEAEAIEKEEKRRINCHNELVDKFARFLMENGVTVVHEGQVRDKSVLNLMRWFQEQLKDCDYIILIITRSFHHYLSNPKSVPPNGEEPFFEGEFLHNLIHKPGKPLLPVFLGGDKKDLSLLPDSLRSSSTYHVRTTSQFSLHESEMDNLYAILTDQNRFAPRPTGRVVQLKRPAGFGPRRQQPTSRLSQAKYQSLRDCSRLVSTTDLKVAESDSFSKHWKKVAGFLDIPAAEVERIEGDETDLCERCYKMLRYWKRRENDLATVARLAEAVWKCQDEALLGKAHEVFCPI